MQSAFPDGDYNGVYAIPPGSSQPHTEWVIERAANEIFPLRNKYPLLISYSDFILLQVKIVCLCIFEPIERMDR